MALRDILFDRIAQKALKGSGAASTRLNTLNRACAGSYYPPPAACSSPFRVFRHFLKDSATAGSLSVSWAIIARGTFSRACGKSAVILYQVLSNPG
jgi:hypothetical protein